MDEQKECSCSWLLLRELAKNHESIVSEPLPDSPDQVPQLLESPADEKDETGWVTYGQVGIFLSRRLVESNGRKLIRFCFTRSLKGSKHHDPSGLPDASGPQEHCFDRCK